MYLKAMAATMASSEIQIVNIANLSKIENFLNDSAYKEILENSENYNTRLCIERRLRMPFLDPQTGVAQNHCALFMKRQQRMPGLREGQIYTYPAARWRKSRRQYLLHQHRPFRVLKEESEPIPVAALDGSSMGAGDTDSKDSHSHSMNMSMSMSHRDEPKDWYYDEMSMHDVDGFEVNDPDSDYDYEDSYRKRKRGRKAVAPEGPPKKRTNRGRRKKDPDTPSRRKGGNTNNANTGAAAQSSSACASPLSMSSLPSDDQPLSSTMPMSNESTMSPHMLTPMTPVSPHPMQPYSPQMQQPPMQLQQLQPPMSMGQPPQPAIPGQPPQGYPQPSPALQAHLMAQQQHQQQQQQQQHPQSHPSQMQQTTGPGATPHTGQPAVEGESERMRKNLEKGKAAPSPYCDFCLGDTRENKKSGMPEDLVSCADCGRSGHPTCLQFTPNMIISVKRYRWQCIECKYCSICGTSDNDDQLLFCDDCDRGYHMYCLAPPLTDPPEGSWSCKLCQQEFHSGKK